MTQTEALKMALEALEHEAKVGNDDAYRKERDAIKEALAQPEQTNTRPYYTIDKLNAWADEKEKKAWRNAAIRVGEELSKDSVPLYTTPPQRTWVGLTDEEVVHLKMIGRDLEFVSMTALRRFAKDIEAKLREKNT